GLSAGAGADLGATLGAARGVAHHRTDVAPALGLLARRAGRAPRRGLPVSTTRIVVIAKAPQPGRVKTRLIPALGAEGAAALAARMLACTVVVAFEAAGAADTADPALGVVELCASPAPGDPAWQGVVVPAG